MMRKRVTPTRALQTQKAAMRLATLHHAVLEQPVHHVKRDRLYVIHELRSCNSISLEALSHVVRKGHLLRNLSEENLEDERVLASSVLQKRKKLRIRKTEIANYVCKKTNITIAPCRKRTGDTVLRAENFGDLMTVDHKVLREGFESRHNFRYV